MRTILSFLATVFGWLNLAVATICCATGSLLTFWVPPRGWMVTVFARLWSHWWLWGSGVRVRRVGSAEAQQLAGGIFLANHVSWYDIPALIVSVPGRVRFMAKRTLFQVPLFGWALHAGGFIPVDREDRSRAKESFQAAIEQLRHGGALILFPEGTRSRDGKVHTFQRGGFLLALKAGLPIVPVGVEGTHTILPRTTLRVRPGTITVHFGEPLDPAEYGLRGRKELMQRVRREVAELSGRGLAEGPPVEPLAKSEEG
ncbi:MAG: lysophospholipid acyltransferase family protein [Acidobacteriota bacterium]|nr:lysophospholipid acyltransferase family protein [Acidobacteriota bacterium]